MPRFATLWNGVTPISSLQRFLDLCDGFTEWKDGKYEEQDAHVDDGRRQEDAEPIGKVFPLHLVWGERLWTRLTVRTRLHLQNQKAIIDLGCRLSLFCHEIPQSLIANNLR